MIDYYDEGTQNTAVDKEHIFRDCDACPFGGKIPKMVTAVKQIHLYWRHRSLFRMTECLSGVIIDKQWSAPGVLGRSSVCEYPLAATMKILQLDNVFDPW